MASKILIIENNEKSAAALINNLRGTGLATERVKDTSEALNYMSTQIPDLLLMNLRPPGKIGIEFITRLRRSAITRPLPIILMSSAYRGAPYKTMAAKLGVKDYLEMPFSMGKLIGSIRNSLPTITTVTMPIHRHLRRAFLSRFSGIYSLKRISDEKSLVFFDGAPTYISPGFFHADFGRYLRHRNIISTKENAYFSGEGQFRQEALIQMGCLEYAELLQEKLVYLTEELVAAFGHPPVTVTEHPFRCPPGLQPIAANVPEIFYQGHHRHADLPMFKRQLSALSYRYISRAENFYRYINFLSLTEKEKLFLKKLDGSLPLGEYLNEDRDLDPLVLTLSALNMVRFNESPGTQDAPKCYPLRVRFNDITEPDPTGSKDSLESFIELLEQAGPETEIPPVVSKQQEVNDPLPLEIRQTLDGLKGKNYYEIFGLTPDEFTPARLRDRYFHYIKKFSSTTLMHLSGETAIQAQEILDRVATSYNILSDKIKKERYDEILLHQIDDPDKLSSDRIQAQVQARAGRIYLENNEWDIAEKSLHEACNLEPFNGEWIAHWAWAIFRNPLNADSEALREKAKQMINRALGLERTPHGHAYKGWMLLEGNQNLQALEEFTQALKLDARLVLAREGHKLAAKKSESNRKGFFRRIFGQ